MSDKNKDKNKLKRVFKSMQLLGPDCLNKKVRLRLPTNEGIWFEPTNLSQINQQRATGWIEESDFVRSSCQRCINRWIRLYLATGKSIRFYPLRYAGERIFGRINTNDYQGAACPPLPTIPTTLTGKWEEPDGGVISLIQDDPYMMEGLFVNGEEGSITYATPWGFQVYGQWKVEGRIGRFRWQIAADQKSFNGTWGNGDSFDNGGGWNGRKTSDDVFGFRPE